MTTLRVRPEADRDVETAAAYFLIAANLDVALRFVSAVEDAYEQLLEHPLAGSSISAFHPRLDGLRHWPVPGFEMHISTCLLPVRSRSCVYSTARKTLEWILGDRSMRSSDA